MDAIRFRFGQTKQLLVILAVRSTTEILLRAARSPAHSEMGSELAVRYAKPKNETATARLIDNYYMALCWLAVRRSVTLHVLRTFNADVSMNTDTPADSQLPTLKAIAQLISFFFAAYLECLSQSSQFTATKSMLLATFVLVRNFNEIEWVNQWTSMSAGSCRGGALFGEFTYIVQRKWWQ